MCLREAKKALWPIWWTRNKAIIEQIQAERASRYLWRKYKELIVKPLSEEEDREPTRIVWVCWLQGIENAPQIVKSCVESVKRQMAGYEVRLLTAENIWNYVTLPEHIVCKYKDGIISFTHFSDILRTALLVQHGGIWVDATVLLTESLPQEWTEFKLFFLQRSVLNKTPHFGSNWFLIARKGNAIMRRQLELLCDYWKNENKVRDYFIYHLFLYLLLTRNNQGRKALHEITYVPNVDAHCLQFKLFDDFDSHQWAQITSRSPIHKLTWKFNHNEPLDKEGTNYDYILHHMHL